MRFLTSQASILCTHCGDDLFLPLFGNAMTPRVGVYAQCHGHCKERESAAARTVSWPRQRAGECGARVSRRLRKEGRRREKVSWKVSRLRVLIYNRHVVENIEKTCRYLGLRIARSGDLTQCYEHVRAELEQRPHRGKARREGLDLRLQFSI